MYNIFELSSKLFMRIPVLYLIVFYRVKKNQINSNLKKNVENSKIIHVYKYHVPLYLTVIK